MNVMDVRRKERVYVIATFESLGGAGTHVMHRDRYQLAPCISQLPVERVELGICGACL